MALRERVQGDIMKPPRETLFRPSSPSITRLSSRPWILLKEALPYLLAFTLAVAAVGCFLRWHISHDHEEEILSWQARLSGVADDQAQRVSDWLKERQGDAGILLPPFHSRRLACL